MDSHIVTKLERSLPACTVIFGIGADFSIPRYIARHYRVSPVDYLEKR